MTWTSILRGGHDLKNLIITNSILALLLCTSLAQAQSLKGSPTSIDKQYRAAVAYGYTFVKTSSAVRNLVDPGYLVRVSPDRYMELHNVSYPYARPGAKLFLNRLSAQYYSACGEKLGVTSLLRPKDRQPANSVAHSVHPTGMAIDLRVPRTQRCNSWLQNTLLSLEKDNLVEVTREHYPPHFHVAVLIKNYETRVAALTGSRQGHADRKGDTLPRSAAYAGSNQGYVVRRGDTLSEIAARTGVPVSKLRSANGLRGNLINAGQKLQIPSTGTNDVLALNTVTHRVNRGDTLWGIANRYGTSVKQLRRVNGWANDSLQVGQVLHITSG
jgi:LysM repeat protein